MLNDYKNEMKKIHLTPEQNARILNGISDKIERRQRIRFGLKLIPLVAMLLVVTLITLRANALYQQFTLERQTPTQIVNNSDIVLVGRVDRKLESFTLDGNAYDAYEVKVLATYLGDRYQTITLITDACSYISCLTGTVDDTSVELEKYYLFNLLGITDTSLVEKDLPYQPFYAPYTWSSGEIVRYNITKDPNQQPTLTFYQKEIMKLAKRV